MADSIVTKTCRVCKTDKPLSEFCKHRSRKDGLNSDCRTCARAQGAQWRKRPEYALEHRQYAREYRKTDKHKAIEKAYLSRPEIRDRKNATKLALYYKNPEKTFARLAVGKAVDEGKLPRAETIKCRDCESFAKEWHHHSYEKEFWLDVVALCETCHDKLHSLRHEENGQTRTPTSARPTESRRTNSTNPAKEQEAFLPYSDPPNDE